ncbi:hypothetical protein AB0D57_16825 [Streptomyces sp. NPDC048275]|uniref:hypothetical protein n=1 Tax=Streptomyces sp. NPDC048275 TaxID=3155629 RepID=UPI0033F61A7A
MRGQQEVVVPLTGQFTDARPGVEVRTEHEFGGDPFGERCADAYGVEVDACELSISYGGDVDLTTTLGLTLKTDEFPRD